MGANQFQVFSKGEVGRMHVLVHRLTDERRYELGHRFLGDWLDGTPESADSDHVHMHWHMGVFELALGEWTAAYARFNEFILPAVDRGEAATDAPAMLWRLRLNAPRRNSESTNVLPRLGQALRAFANEDYGIAAVVLRENMPRLSAVGGSDAQRQLFDRITEFADAASR